MTGCLPWLLIHSSKWKLIHRSSIFRKLISKKSLIKKPTSMRLKNQRHDLHKKRWNQWTLSITEALNINREIRVLRCNMGWERPTIILLTNYLNSKIMKSLKITQTMIMNIHMLIPESFLLAKTSIKWLIRLLINP